MHRIFNRLLLVVMPAGARTGVGGAGLTPWFRHPVSGPDHPVALLAVGLWGGFPGRTAIWVLAVLFPAVMAVAGAVRQAPLGLALPVRVTGT